jgi:drug/metabolite transporter (DMT)-like permease
MTAPDNAHRALLIIGTVCGVLAAFGWAAGFVVAKHGIEVGFKPADLAFHRFFWSGLLLMPMAYRAGLKDLGGVGWGRGVIVTLLSGPPQAIIAYTGFISVPVGHGTTIQPACAALSGLILAALFLGEKVSLRRMIGAAAIVLGLMIYGAEALTTIGSHGVIGDLMFVAAGIGWAAFGTLLRKWHLDGMRAIGAVAVFSVFFFAPLYFLLFGIDNLVRHGIWENLLQAVVQGVIAGALPIYLFAHSVMALGAGRAGTFPAIVPVFGVLIGFAALGAVPTWMQLVGLVVVLIGFQFTLRR